MSADKRGPPIPGFSALRPLPALVVGGCFLALGLSRGDFFAQALVGCGVVFLFLGTIGLVRALWRSRPRN